MGSRVQPSRRPTRPITSKRLRTVGQGTRRSPGPPATRRSRGVRPGRQKVRTSMTDIKGLLMVAALALGEADVRSRPTRSISRRRRMPAGLERRDDRPLEPERRDHRERPRAADDARARDRTHRDARRGECRRKALRDVLAHREGSPRRPGARGRRCRARRARRAEAGQGRRDRRHVPDRPRPGHRRGQARTARSRSARPPPTRSSRAAPTTARTRW